MATPILTPFMQRLQAATAAANVQDAGPAPLIPSNPFGGGMGLSATPNLGPPPVANVAPSASLTHLDKLHSDQAGGSGLSQIQNPWLRGVARVADVAGSIVAPRVLQLAGNGTTLGHEHQLALDQGVVNNDLSTAHQQAANEDAQAQAAQRKAMADKASAQADAFTPMELTPEMAQAAGAPELAGHPMTSATYSKILSAHQANDSKETIAGGHDTTKVTTTGMNNETSKANNAASNYSHETIAAASDKTKALVASMHDNTSRANNADTNASKVGGAGVATPGGKAFKVPADVTKRGALATNVTENTDVADRIIKENPEIVGSIGGRFTSIQQMAGSDNPAIHALGVTMHNIALASNGAHGVRAAGAIEQTEKELFNNFKSGPNGIHASLDATRRSMQTFLDDEKNFQTTGQRIPSAPANGAPPAGAKVRDYTQLGAK